MYMPHFVYSSLDGHLSCFSFSTSVNSSAVNVGVQISPLDAVFNTFEYIPRSGIARLYSLFHIF